MRKYDQRVFILIDTWEEASEDSIVGVVSKREDAEELTLQNPHWIYQEFIVDYPEIN